MYKGHRITTVLPAHNEARHIGGVVRTMPDFVDSIIVVDDCSKDDTFEVASNCGDDRVIAIRTPSNQGVGGAVVLGYRKGLEINSDILVKMDGDGQMDPTYLSSLLDCLIEHNYDYAKGNRFLAGESLAFMPKHRLVGNIILTFMTKLASGYWHVFDPQNGYTAIKSAALLRLNLEAMHRRFFFENDMLIHLNFFDFRVKDVSIPARYGEEVSDLNPFKISVTFPLLLLRRFFYRVYQKYVLRDFSPIALFLFLGLILAGWGALFGIYLWIESQFTHQLTPTGTIMLSLLPLILGFQLLLQAVVLDIQETPK
ncbi:MAG: glycosyltransferase family 2 protein [Blastocatellia bacterium]